MLTVYNCIANEHDLRLVGLAAAICALASWTAISLLYHVRLSKGRIRLAWLGVAAASTGFGIWATHFIAMLAFEPGLPSAYNIALTVLSLIVAIVVTGAGLAIAVGRNSAVAAAVGGVVVGGGIAAMHYIGMAAFEIEGHLTWNHGLVAASILLGGAISAAALPVGLHRDTLKWKALGALLLTIAICSLHFTGMAAVSIVPDPTIEFSPAAIPTGWLAVAVALASFMIILLSFAGLVIDMRDRRRAALEIERMRGLANAAVEGLVICDGGAIVTVNDSFAALVGLPAARMIGAAFAAFVPEEGTRLKLSDRPNRSVEGDLHGADGSKIPVELIRRPVDFGGIPHDAVAVRDLRARKEAEQHIRFLAHHDALTGLANRSSFHKKLDQEIESALATRRPLAVMCLDLDRFKEVNDLFGHAEGDRVLQMVAKRISGVLDDSQMVARLSGDEFAVIIPRLPNPGIAGRIAENILEVLQNMSESKDETLVSISIGIAICPDDAIDRQSLLSHADTALYRAKKEGRATYRFFEAAMGAEVRNRRLLELELRNAIARDELRLVYQPQKEIRSGKTIGFEALLRWKHPTRGEIPPSLFIPIAEECSAILQIGEWVLRRACAEAASWSEDLTIAVNVSTVQIHNTNFAHTLHEILFETGLKPERLELEITETALVRDLDRAVATLRRIKLLGVRIAMDDFGTGYSSLSNLRAFPFDKIKIDGSFIKSVNVSEQAATIVRAVLGLGQGLGLPVLAEGVETAAQLQFLESESCQEAQGFWLGKPAEIERFRQLTHGGEAPEEPAVVIPLHSKSSSN
jgi:diguanylate cyclase (GGDEF)-like protein/PAS domain S-box-containing protein